jgi:hypothetical protein
MTHRKHWMVCDVTDRNETRCLFDEVTALKRGDPPRCIRHGSLFFGDSRLDGLGQKDARKLLSQLDED